MCKPRGSQPPESIAALGLEGVITGTKLFFSLAIKTTRPFSEVDKNTLFSKQHKVDESYLVVGLGVVVVVVVVVYSYKSPLL